MDTNDGTYGRCISLINKKWNASLLFVRKHGVAPVLFILIEQQPKRILAHGGKYVKWKGIFLPINVTDTFLRLITGELIILKQYQTHQKNLITVILLKQRNISYISSNKNI